MVQFRGIAQIRNNKTKCLHRLDMTITGKVRIYNIDYIHVYSREQSVVIYYIQSRCMCVYI